MSKRRASGRGDQAEPVYRFVLYGRAKSGKTCYLAALARIFHPLLWH